jgi:hypothetical protein
MQLSRMHCLATAAALGLLATLAASSRPPAPSPAPQASSPLDPSKMPDIAGLHIGMSAQDAKAVLAKASNNQVRLLPIGFGPGNKQQAVYSLIAGGGPAGSITADVTMPPNPQLVWHIARGAAQPSVNRAVLLAALRQKYGKETYATAWGGKATDFATDDSNIRALVWLMDEQGRPLTTPVKLDAGANPFGCSLGADNGGLPSRPPDYQPSPNFCAQSFVGLSIQFPKGEIITATNTTMVDYPLAQRSAQATDAYTKAGNQQIQQQQQQKAQEAKPSI